MKTMKLVCIMLSLLILGGCAHSIDINPNTEKMEQDFESKSRIKKNVGYYISEAQRDLEVNSRGGGGDSVNYYPYRDIENAFEKMLSGVFEHVTKMKSLTDSGGEVKFDINYVITPEIVTESFSTSSFTWPPTNFIVNLASKITDTSAKQIKIIKVIGEGQAEYSEFLWDKGLAGKRAMENALLKMKRSLFEANYENSATDVQPVLFTIPKDIVAEKLERLKGLSDRGLITPEEFNKKKKEILDGM